MHGSLHVPLAHVTAAASGPAPNVPWFSKLIGTNMPGVIAAGTFFDDGGWAFYDYRAGSECLLLDLDHEHYKRAVVEIDSPQTAAGAARQIAAAIGRAAADAGRSRHEASNARGRAHARRAAAAIRRRFRARILRRVVGRHPRARARRDEIHAAHRRTVRPARGADAAARPQPGLGLRRPLDRLRRRSGGGGRRIRAGRAKIAARRVAGARGARTAASGAARARRGRRRAVARGGPTRKSATRPPSASTTTSR